MTKEERERVARCVSIRLWDYHRGKELAVKGDNLIKEMELNIDTPALRSVVNKARNMGYAIGSSPQDGYWYCANLLEIQDVVKSLESRAKKILSASHKMKRGITDQIEITY